MPGQKNPGNHVRDTSKPTPKSKPKPNPKTKSSTPSKNPKSTPITAHPPPTPNPTPNPTTNPKPPYSLPPNLHQNILTTFSTAFSHRLREVPKLKADIQVVKGFLFNREFEKAFADEGFLEAYVVRWSAVRAVAYVGVFGEGGLGGVLRGGGGKKKGRGKVVCFGGGAGAEVVALGGLVGWRGVEGGGGGEGVGEGDGGGKDGDEDGEDGDQGGGQGEVVKGWDIVVLDIAPWASGLSKLETAITTSPISSSPATSNSNSNSTTTTANGPLIHPANFNLTFQQCDILDMSSRQLKDLCQDAKMVTLMFTLNELYSISIAKTTKTLLDLTGCVEKGCLLVVVDSPGSYSTLALNHNSTGASGNVSRSDEEKELTSGGGSEKEKEKQKEVKKYPMKWLLDHTLLEVAKDGGGDERKDDGEGEGEGGKRWEKMHSEDSRWCRLREELKYPIALEDMRMQVHVYRRLGYP
ncbi:MAG: hypothetical protein L6R42_009232 [Xanthoria sp. 1 TBL-2021]|nr:MAG: hypothetical protein L6R42_009232 [Xanthoria sp. 1 TBL-2021]